MLYQSQGRFAEAEPLLVQALELCERVLGVNHPNTITVLKNLELFRQERSIDNSSLSKEKSLAPFSLVKRLTQFLKRTSQESRLTT
jgi:hypothetical protein